MLDESNVVDNLPAVADVGETPVAPTAVQLPVPIEIKPPRSRPPARATLNLGALRNQLQRVTLAIEKRTSIPVLGHVRIEVKHGTAVLTGTDLDQCITAQLPCEHKRRAFAVVVNGHDLLSMLGTFNAKDTVIANSEGLFQVGRAKLQLEPFRPVTDFPEFGDLVWEHEHSIAAADLATACSQVSFAMSSEETRYYLNGAALQQVMTADGPKRGAFRVAAADGHRLAARSIAMKGKDWPVVDGGVIIPSAAVCQIIKIGAKANGAARLAIATRTHPSDCMKIDLMCDEGPVCIRTRLVQGTYPDIDRVFPSCTECSWSVDRETFAKALARVSRFAGNRAAAAKLTFDRGRLTLSAALVDGGRFEESIQCKGSGKTSYALGFNARYALDLCKQGGTRLKFEPSPEGGPARVTIPGLKDVVFLLMPMRV